MRTRWETLCRSGLPSMGGRGLTPPRGRGERMTRSVEHEPDRTVATLSNMARTVPHVHADVSDVANRVMRYHRAPESERLSAIAELTRRRVAFSGTFAATIAALVVASLVGASAAYTSYISLAAQSVAAGREDAVALSESFREMGAGKQSADALELATQATRLLADTAELVPGTLVILACATALTLMWAVWSTRRASIAGAWLAVYAVEPERVEEAPAPAVERRGLWSRLARRRRAPQK